jgi:hypothetical protein
MGFTKLGSAGAGLIVGVSNIIGINKTGAVGTGLFVGNFTMITGFFVGFLVENLRRIGLIVGFFVGFFVVIFTAGGAVAILIGLDITGVGGRANVCLQSVAITQNTATERNLVR